MNFSYSAKSRELQNQLQAFIDTHVVPVEDDYRAFQAHAENRWKRFPPLAGLKEKAKEAGLFNLFLPKEYGARSPGLTTLEYAPLAELMGRKLWVAELFNCSAPDTGNMEVLAKYGSTTQQNQWLNPLMDGAIRSAFLMTEPDVASSDATNIQTSIRRQGDEYIINGTKWWASGGMDPLCRFAIVMGKTNPSAARHRQQSMIIIPMDADGLQVERPLSVFGYYDSPEGHAEITLTNVRVPKENLIGEEGHGFEIAQGRLGPGRIHHCMRLVGMAQYALELMARRANERTAFGRPFKDMTAVRAAIAQSKCDIEQARLLTLSAADKIDRLGNKAAKDLIAMIKIVAPQMACTVIDRAIQLLGGKGLGPDTYLPHYYAAARALRLADGPDEVHLHQLGKHIIESQTPNE